MWVVVKDDILKTVIVLQAQFSNAKLQCLTAIKFVSDLTLRLATQIGSLPQPDEIKPSLCLFVSASLVLTSLYAAANSPYWDMKPEMHFNWFPSAGPGCLF